MGGDLVFVTGHTGFLGRWVVARLEQQGYSVAVVHGLDLRSQNGTLGALVLTKPKYVVHLAYPGGDGIGDALAHPASLASDLLRMDMNVIEACATAHVEKLVCIGSVCAYPAQTVLPTDESQLWNGYPEPVNASYGIVKRAQLALLQAHRQEYGLSGIHLILPNLYGPGDTSKHVIPALTHRMLNAREFLFPTCTVWGAPEVTRSFLYVEDAAAGIVRALERYDQPEPLNLVNAGEIAMDDLAKRIAHLVGFTGELLFDSSKPTGHRRRQFSTTRMQAALGWYPPTPLTTGLEKTVGWIREGELPCP